ncbi:MAG: InlB B-repeat-containing protein [Clostridiales bacterium]|nr:InlB B-repeat-containing protein [Clostridiales bacterium]
MPISDEVIELAPVKKTKKTLIIMIVGMGVLLAAAIAFLVLYLVKPSVTEDKNHVKDISVNYSELFSELDENGNAVLYASIGNEYTVYSTVTVDDNSSTNVSWRWDPSLIEMKEQKTEDGAYFKFIPRIGMHNKKATITACAASHVESSQKIEFTIVNQGAVDIQVKQYGVSGNMHTVKDDTYDKVLELTVPYYTMAQTDNNKSFRVNFNQTGKYNATSNEYAKLTCVDIGDSKNTGDVSVALKNPADSKYITIHEDSITPTDFYFTANGSTNNSYVEIILKANVNNADCEDITKTIKVKVESNTVSKYVDTMFVFNKPVVDAEFMGGVLTSGNATLVDPAKIRAELSQDASLKVQSGNRKILQSSADFELMLPYNKTVTYNEIFRHVMVNPANIQYAGDKIIDNWYQYIKVESSDTSVLTVNGGASATGNVKLCPTGLSGLSGGVVKCKLTLTDTRPGSAGAKVEVPVRIVAQTTGASLKLIDDKTTYEGNNLAIDAGTGKTYTVSVTYTFVANDVKPETLQENGCLNNAYTLKFDEDELEVKLKGDDKTLAPDTVYKATYKEIVKKVSSGNNSQYAATLDFDVKVKKDDDGSAVFRFVKEGSYLYDTGADNSLNKLDVPADISASFKIMECATTAKVVDFDDGIKAVTNDGEVAGNYVRNSDKKATLYVQRQAKDTILELITPENVKKLIVADKSYFEISTKTGSFVPTISNNSGFSWNTTAKAFSFTDTQVSSEVKQATIKFDVLNVTGGTIAQIELDIHIIDAITKIVVPVDGKTVSYGSDGNAAAELKSSDVQMERKYNTSLTDFAYNDVDLYYNENIKFGADAEKITSKTRNEENNTISFKHKEKELYVFDVNRRTLTCKTDIYAYSRQVGINFGEVELEFLFKSIDEYKGKHTGAAFNANDIDRMEIKFVRKADDVALFSHADCERDDVIPFDTNDKGNKEFKIRINQDVDADIYACSIVKIGEDLVYVERKSDKYGKIAPVDQASFSLPAGITPITYDGPQSGRYYYITYRTPEIDGASKNYEGGTVYFSGNSDNALTVVVNNETRTIKKIGFFSDEACDNSVSELLFGGFINNADKYTVTVYIKVEYSTLLPSHTAFETLELALPSYLELVSGNLIPDTNSYILIPSDGVKDINEKVFTCVIRLIGDEQVTNDTNIEAMPINHKGDGKNAKCTARVKAGLNTLTVKNGNTDVATVTAGNTGNYSYAFALSNKSDIQSLTLGFTYVAINGGGYDIAYDHVGAGLKLVCPSIVNGLTLENNIKAAVSELTIKIDAANVIALNNQKITFTFTDEYNGTNANNVFTLDIYITVTFDIYELAFKEDTNAAVTVTGESSGKQSLGVSVIYNDGNANTQPTVDTIKDNTVLGVYVLEDGNYKLCTNGISVKQDANDESGKSYIVEINNNIDRTKTYYLRLVYDNVIYNGEKHIRTIVINTLTSHIEFDGENSIKPMQVQGENCPSAGIVVESASDEFTLVANVVNDGSGNVESGKKANYGLYTDFNCTTAASGITVNDGVIKVTNPTAITGTVYYLADYTEQKTGEPYTLKVKLTYTVAPSAVNIIGVDTNVFNASENKLTLYYNGASDYIQANLFGKLEAVTAFNGVNYATTDNISFAIALQDNDDSAYLEVSGYVLKPKALKNNTVTTVPVVVKATYAGVTVEHVYNIVIAPFNALTFAVDSGSLNLLNKNSELTVTPTIESYNGFTHTYDLLAADGLFAITSDGDVKTVKLASNTAAKVAEYELNATLVYVYNGGSDSGITQVGTFGSTATYTVNVVGEYTPKFELSDGNNIPTYDSASGNTKHPILDNATYSIALSDIPDVSVAYRAESTNSVISIAEFNNENRAIVTLNSKASGSFTITVFAKIGGEEFRSSKTYYFVYGDNVESTLSVSNNGGSSYSAFNATEQAIDFTTTAYRFKYEISGLPSEATVNLVVNGEVDKIADTTGSTDATRYIVVTAAKPTTLRIGGTVQIGSRTIYLDDKTVKLTATAPDFELNVNNNITEILPAGTASFSIGNASGFQGTKTVSYAVDTNACATINATTGVLTANSNVLTDQTVLVTATITVSSGVYADTYTLSKSITIKGVPLPTIKWKDSAKADIATGEVNSRDYSSLYTFDDVAQDYTYTKTIVIAASSTSLADTDYSISDGVLTINNTVTAGGTVTLTVTATITSDVHKNETVSDKVIVRVLPKMSTAVTQITLGNAKNTYDFNSDAFKSIFAPNTADGDSFVKSGDTYNVVDVHIVNTGNTADFVAKGSKLTVNNDLSEAKQLQVEVQTLITSGAYKGVTVSGVKTITFALPTKPADKSFTWSNNKYNTLTLSALSDIMGNVSGTVQSVVATVDGDAADYVTVTTGEGANVELSVAKEYGAYLTGDSGNKTFDVNYVVTLADGKVYCGTATYNVPKQKITVKAEIGGEELTESAFEVKSGEIVLIDLSADKGFTVNVKNATVANTTSDSNTYLAAVSVGDGVRLNASSVSADQTVKLTLELSVAGLSTTLEYTVKVIAPQTSAAYTTDDREIYIKKDSSEEVTSAWSYKTSDYKYGESVKIQVSSGRLSDYFSQIKVDGKTATISGNNVTVNFDKQSISTYPFSVRPSLTDGFNLDFIFKTTEKIDFTFTVTLTVYNSQTNNRNSITVPYSYRVHVIDDLTVAFDTNGDNVTDCVESKVVNFKTSYGELPDPKRVGYTFGGWYTARTGGTRVYDSTTVTATQNHTLYARWNVCTYNLDYDVTVADEYKKTVEYNKQYGALPTPTQVGYDFVGWKDGEGNTIVASSLVQPTNYLSGTITLTAQWQIKYFTVTLNENYTDGTNWSMPVQEGADFELHNSITPTRAGYRFDGWYVAADGNTKAAAKITVTADVTIYAHWTQMYTVTLAANGGQFGHDSATGYTTKVANGGEFSLHWGIEPTRVGYKFDGWFTEKEGGEDKTGVVIEVDRDFTLYAHWTQLFTVKLLNFDKSVIFSYEVAKGDTFDKHVNMVLIDEDSRFDGWFTQLSGGNKVTEEFTVTANRTLYAQWTPKYTVTLDANYGTVAGNSAYDAKVVKGEDYSLHLSVLPTREGFTFDGWYTEKTGGTKQDSAIINVSENITLYAHWTEIPEESPDETLDNNDSTEDNNNEE